MLSSIIKKISLLIFCLLPVTSSMAQDSKTYEEGVHYKVIEGTVVSSKKEVREFFSFWCGHCYALQGVYSYVEKEVTKNGVSFVSNPVGLLGGPMGVESQRAHAVANMLGIKKEFMATLFEMMHVDGDIPRSHKDFVDVFASLGIPENVLQKDWSSFAVIGEVSSYDKYMDMYKIDAVPEIVVNGKYLVIQESVEKAGELLDLVNYLLSKDVK